MDSVLCFLWEIYWIWKKWCDSFDKMKIEWTIGNLCWKNVDCQWIINSCLSVISRIANEGLSEWVNECMRIYRHVEWKTIFRCYYNINFRFNKWGWEKNMYILAPALDCRLNLFYNVKWLNEFSFRKRIKTESSFYFIVYSVKIV